MSADETYYRTIYRIEVLSCEPLGSVSLEDIAYLVTEGPCSGQFLETVEETVSPEAMSELLINQGSDPAFFFDEV